MGKSKQWVVKSVEIRPGVRTLEYVAASREDAERHIKRILHDYNVSPPAVVVR